MTLMTLDPFQDLIKKMYPDEDPHNRHTHEGTKVSSSLSSDISILGSDLEVPGSKEIKPARILGESMMMITYRWELEDVERKHQTISSKMICFRGEKLFRVGLKNRVEPTLIFLAINLNKIGMRVREVGFDAQNSEYRQSMTHNNVDGHSLQLFTFDLGAMVVGNCVFTFSIWLEGSSPGCYSYQLCDRLAKHELWNASSDSKHDVDVEIVCKAGKKFSAHKAILAARSPVFEEMADKQPTHDTSNGPLLIHIDDVDASTVEEFLYFIYTGEAKSISLANEELLKLARRYQIKSLIELCEIALKKVDVMQMANFVSNLELGPAECLESPPFIVRPDEDTELNFGHHESTFRCVWVFKGRKAAEKPLAINYQNKNLFSLHLKDDIVHFICVNHRKFVNQVLYSTDSKKWIKMKPKNAKHKLEKSEMLFFVAKTDDVDFDHSSEQTIHFDVKMISTIGNYRYEMMDPLWTTQLWNAALERQLTDVDIYVGKKLLMEAHQVILSARSPILAALLGKMKKHNGKATITFEADIDSFTVKHFLYFLYTGSSKVQFSNKQFLSLANIHEVETLSEVCKLAMVSSPDVDEVTNFLLANF